MDNATLIAIASIVTAGLTIALGSIGPALGEGRAVATALSSLRSNPTPPRRSRAPCLWDWR
jgi:F-type H+-transporting ATPase subunit c